MTRYKEIWRDVKRRGWGRSFAPGDMALKRHIEDKWIKTPLEPASNPLFVVPTLRVMSGKCVPSTDLTMHTLSTHGRKCLTHRWGDMCVMWILLVAGTCAEQFWRILMSPPWSAPKVNNRAPMIGFWEGVTRPYLCCSTGKHTWVFVLLAMLQTQSLTQSPGSDHIPPGRVSRTSCLHCQLPWAIELNPSTSYFASAFRLVFM